MSRLKNTDASPGGDEAGAPIEARFFSAINRLTEPAVRAGLGSLWVMPAGMVVLEVSGRRTGEIRRVPVLAAEIGEYVVVSTLRVQRSEWLRNVLANPDIRYWIRGRPHDARGLAILPGADLPEVEDEDLRCVVEALSRQGIAWGAAFVVLIPAERTGNLTGSD
jgi:hypothetical protein